MHKAFKATASLLLIMFSEIFMGVLKVVLLFFFFLYLCVCCARRQAE